MTEREYIRAKRSFGQNFLADHNFVSRIIDAARISPADTVVEIGPGLGVLTDTLILQAGRVIAVELDRDLVAILVNKFGQHDNFRILSADALTLDYGALAKEAGTDLKLVANLPYYISTAILQRLIAYRAEFSDMVLMLQREVVDRIMAAPGNSDRGYLTVLVDAFMIVEKLFDVPPTAFRPSPKVWSSVVRLRPRIQPEISRRNEEKFFRLVSAAFRQKRKTLMNNLKASASELGLDDPAALLAKAGIDGKRRAESLTLTEWALLADALS